MTMLASSANFSEVLIGKEGQTQGLQYFDIQVATTRSSELPINQRNPDGTPTGTIVDEETGQRITSDTFFSIGVVGDTVYAGGIDGLVKTVDNAAHPFGLTWEIFRAYEPLSPEVQSYSYPNPFSPRFDVTRIHYGIPAGSAKVTIEVFDFGMNRVRTVVRDGPRSGAAEYDEIWDGRDDGGSVVPNGVYFYRVIVGDNEPLWGKIMVLA